MGIRYRERGEERARKEKQNSMGSISETGRERLPEVYGGFVLFN